MLCCRDAEYAATKILMLLRYQPDLHATSRNGCTALSIAAEAGHADAVKIMLEQVTCSGWE